MQEVVSHQQNLKNDNEECEICCLTINTHSVRLFLPSLICYQCWYQHIKAMITKISYKTGSDLLSPFDGQKDVDISVALNTLKKHHANQLQEWLFKKYSSFTTDIEKCPSQSCDFVFMVEKCKWRTIDEKCPKCEAILVNAADWGIKSIIGFIYFLLMTNKCPKCEIPIQKTSGCPHMSCPCGHQFCWFCLKDYFNNRNNVYGVHQPMECAFIFISKIIFMTICLAGIVLTFLGNDLFHRFVQYFFIALKYILFTLIIDLIIIGNILAISNIIQKVRTFRTYGDNDRKKMIKIVIASVICIDILVIYLAFYFQWWIIIFMIIVIQLSAAGAIALGAWLVIYSSQTWFDYIC